jgi:hypothetical protein
MLFRNARVLASAAALIILLTAALWSPAPFQNPAVNPAHALETQLHPPAAVRGILRRACYDCHGSNTRWPWYTHLRPIRSRIEQDVTEGRAALNFSEWSLQTKGDPELEGKTLQTSCALMQAGMMPPNYYLYLHPDAAVNHRDVRAICAWAQQWANKP